MEETYVINCTFTTDQGKLYTLSVSDADPTIIAADIKTAMQAIQASGVIISKNGELNGLKTAKLIKTEALPIDVS